MALVLDARVAAGVPLQDRVLEGHVDAALSAGKCYMTLASVTEFACLVASGCGWNLVEQWVSWILTNPDIEIVELADIRTYTSEDFMVLVAQAFLLAGLLPSAASSAALASLKHWPVLTNREGFRALHQQGFCEVRWAL